MKIAYRYQLRSDETVSSFVARALRLSVSPSHRSALSEVLGAAKVRLHPYLTAHLGIISRQLGVPTDELLVRHTLYPLFRWYGFDTSFRLKAAMLSDHGERAVIVAGLPQSKLHFYEGLKFCPVCVREDREQTGYGYYKVDQQVPGVEACFRHGCRLVGVDSGEYGYDRYIPMVPSDVEPALATASQVRLAEFGHEVLELARRFPRSVDYQEPYRRALNERGLLTQKAHLRMRLLKEHLKKEYDIYSFGSALGIPEPLSTFKFVGPLLRHKTHYRCHPAKHLLLASWLFNGDAGHYLTYQASTTAFETKLMSAYPEQKAQVLNLLMGGSSMNEIERMVGRSRSFIRHIAEIHGIPHRTNALAYSEDIRNNVVKLAELGRHRRLIAIQLGVGLGYVEQVIGNTPGLAERRRSLRKQRRIAAAVEELRTIRDLHPNWRRKEVKEQCAQAYFAVYNHDKSLLETLLPPKTKLAGPRKDWAQEDLRLSQAIRGLNVNAAYSISEIDHLIGGRGFLRKSLEKLPTTRAALRELGVVLRPEKCP